MIRGLRLAVERGTQSAPETIAKGQWVQFGGLRPRPPTPKSTKPESELERDNRACVGSFNEHLTYIGAARQAPNDGKPQLPSFSAVAARAFRVPTRVESGPPGYGDHPRGQRIRPSGGTFHGKRS